MFSWGSKKETFDPVKVKANTRMAITRIRMQQNKTINSVKVQRKQLAELLSMGKYDAARVKVEALIREDLSIEGLEVLSLFADLDRSAHTVIAAAKREGGSSGCPSEMKEAVTSVIWAAARLDTIPELQNVRSALQSKFGTEFVETAAVNGEFSVNEKVLQKLGIQTPTNGIEYLKSIASDYGLEFDETKLQAKDALVVPSGMDSSGFGSTIGVSPGAFQVPPIVVPRDDFEARLLALKRQ
ncbi:Hypothetical protein, putative [Bodo saltans]|uniref:Uncharacterized protein n=1 Tax=Bodo saltans TaxID=75058 RepID=A0A0S4IPS2_BODSA|nr:Hypothetical protein, putative [Bodo saltans]|eukprot:CUF89207.1 Hypothetical protein, putative [Bodo saltans]